MGGGSTQSTSTYSPPAAVSEAYTSLLKNANALVYPNGPDGGTRPYPQYGSAAAQGQQDLVNNTVAPFSNNQQQAGNTIASLAGYAQPFVNAGTGLALAGAAPVQLQQFSPNAVNQYMSPYLNSVMGSTINNINETNSQQQQQLMGNLIQKGAFGGDRTGVAQAELARQQGLANNATLANIANTGYTQSLGEFNNQQAMNAQAQMQNRQLALTAAPLLANLGGYGQSAAMQQAQAQYGYGSAEQQQQQAKLSTAFQNYLNQQSYPYQQLGFLGGLTSGAATGMGGTTTSSIPQPGVANQAIGGLGALASLGNLGGMGSGMGSFLSSLGGAGAAAGAGGLLESMGPAAVLAMGFLNTGGSVHDHGAPPFADGGSVGHYASGGPTQDDLMKASPIAGLAATNPFPTVNMQANPHMPSAPSTKMGGLDQATLQNTVNSIKTLMKPKDDGLGGGDYAHGGVVGHYGSGGIIIPDGMMTKDDLRNRTENIAGSGVAGLPGSVYAIASEDLLPSQAANGGLIMKDGGGPVQAPVVPVEGDGGTGEGGTGEGGVAAAPPPVDYDKIAKGAVAYMMPRESAGNPNARSTTSSASGLYGITNGTYRGIIAAHPELGDPGKNDPRVATAHMATLARSMHSQGIEPTNENLRMSWFLGQGGGPSFLRQMQADPNAPAYAAVGADQVRANQSIFFKKDGTPRTTQEVYNVLNVAPAGSPVNPAGGPNASYGQQQRVPQTPTTVDSTRIPIQSAATKEGLFGALGIAMTPEQRLASFQAFAKLAGTPGKFGVGLAAAADTYAKTLLEAQGSSRQNATAQAQTERERASAGLSTAEAISKGFVAGPTGFARFAPGKNEGEVDVTAVPMPDFGKTVTLGANGAQTQNGANPTQTGANPTQTAASTPSAPASPSEAAPKVEDFNFSSLAGDQTPQDKLKIMQEAATGLRGQEWGTQAPKNMEIYNEQNNQAQIEAQAASANRVNLSSLTRAVTDTPSTGWQSRGAGKELRDQVANYLNTGYRMATNSDLGATADNLSSEQLINKVGTLSTQAMQKGLGREAGFWLNTLKSAFPSGGMSEGAAKEILAQMIVEPRQAMDRATVYDQYGKLTKNMGKDVVQVFQRVNNPDQYVRDKQHIKDLLMDKNAIVLNNGKRENMITALQNGTISKEAFDRNAQLKYGVKNLSRYFVGT